MDFQFIGQAIMGLLVISAPMSPDKIILFNSIIQREGKQRTAAASQVAMIAFGVLTGAALIGQVLLELLGINTDAFSVVGGLIIAGMGFEMLYGGAGPKAQGGGVDHDQAQEEGGLIIPLAVPLIAGPGAIATAISITSSRTDLSSLVAGLAGAGVVAVLAFASYQWLGGMMTKLSDTAVMLVTRIGGLILATLGVQMLLGGLKRFWG